jgi:rhomboid family protein
VFIVVPYHVDVPMRRWPWMNWVLIGVTVLFSIAGVSVKDPHGFGQELVLGGGSWLGLVGHVFVHLDVFHLLGNMLFLWVFGNAVCAKVGNIAYLFVYLGLGFLAGIVSSIVDPRPSVGASGAINGIVGMFVVWYLLNEISCWYGFWAFGGVSGTFSVSSFWMVLLWLGFDIWGAATGQGQVAYSAHLAGFGLGALLATLLLVIGIVVMDRDERSLLQVLSSRGDERTPKTDRPSKRRRRRD